MTWTATKFPVGCKPQYLR